MDKFTSKWYEEQFKGLCFTINSLSALCKKLSTQYEAAHNRMCEMEKENAEATVEIGRLKSENHELDIITKALETKYNELEERYIKFAESVNKRLTVK